MDLLSPIQVKLLQDLVVFKQLTIPQFAKLNKRKSEQTIRRALEKLFKRRKPLVHRVEFKRVSHFGKLSYVYSISVYGVNRLEEQIQHKIDEIAFTPYSPKLTDDYFHRVSTIDFHIFMHTQSVAEGYSIGCCDQYFVVKKMINSFYSINKIHLSPGNSIIPDSVIRLKKDGMERWVMYELHNGNDKNRIKEQIKQHAICLTGLYAHSKYNIEKYRFYYILILFESETVMKKVIEDISNDIWYKDVAQFFLCKKKNSKVNSFLNGWTDLAGKSNHIGI